MAIVKEMFTGEVVRNNQQYGQVVEPARQQRVHVRGTITVNQEVETETL